MTPRLPTAREVVRVVYGAGYVAVAVGVLVAVFAAILWTVGSGFAATAFAIFAGLAVGYGALAVGAARVAHWALEVDAPIAFVREETTRVRSKAADATERPELAATDGGDTGGSEA